MVGIRGAWPSQHWAHWWQTKELCLGSGPFSPRSLGFLMCGLREDQPPCHKIKGWLDQLTCSAGMW